VLVPGAPDLGASFGRRERRSVADYLGARFGKVGNEPLDFGTGRQQFGRFGWPEAAPQRPQALG
jgi:hypothetical protein